jgi:bifunctional non-homologous end joining protein LigD
VATKKRSKADGQLAAYRRKRDFGSTPEPAGGKSPRNRSRGTLEFVVQKHAASHLHFDLRLELDGVMKSWAVPKGPSIDPTVRRLAMETEDHPMEYNAFEGIIPEGEYGGGTVMVWDRGRYWADEAEAGEDEERVLRREYERGKMSFTLEGERLRGSFALVRTRGAGGRSSWLLLKHRDEHAHADVDPAVEHHTSVVSGRTMEEIATGRSAIWRSNRKRATKVRPAARRGSASTRRAEAGTRARTPESAEVRPMLAATARRVPEGGEWSFEPSPGGTRVLAYVTPEAVRLVAGGADRVAHHPSIGRELARLSSRSDRSVVLDGEIVAPRAGEPVLHVFDLLYSDGEALAAESYAERRARLEALYRRRRQQHVQLIPRLEDAAAAAREAKRRGWTHIVAKRTDSPYRAGRRGGSWLRVPLPS